MNQTDVVPDNLSTLRKSLPYGSRKIIAERTGTSQYYVTRVLLGLRAFDRRVVDTAISYYIEYETQKKKLEKEIESALENGRRN